MQHFSVISHFRNIKSTNSMMESGNDDLLFLGIKETNVDALWVRS